MFLNHILFYNVCCVLVFTFLCYYVCLFSYWPFCHGALKLDMSTLFTTLFLWPFLQFVLQPHFKFVSVCFPYKMCVWRGNKMVILLVGQWRTIMHILWRAFNLLWFESHGAIVRTDDNIDSLISLLLGRFYNDDNIKVFLSCYKKCLNNVCWNDVTSLYQQSEAN